MAKRSTVNISLPTSLKNWMDEQVDSGGFGTASEYVRHLIRLDRDRSSAFVSTREELDTKLTEALKGPPARPMTSSRWRALRAVARKRLAAARANRRKSA